MNEIKLLIRLFFVKVMTQAKQYVILKKILMKFKNDRNNYLEELI